MVTGFVARPRPIAFMAKLNFTSGKLAGRVYELVVEATKVGRGDANTLVIHDGSVSQNHCEILVNGPEVIVRDLGSSNGTFVNGGRLCDRQTQLLPGQEVRFGSVAARLELEETPTPDTATDVTAIHAHARYQRTRLDANDKPLACGITLESDALSGEHTFMLPRPCAGERSATAPTDAIASEPPKRGQRTPLVVAGATLALALGTLLCWLFSRQ